MTILAYFLILLSALILWALVAFLIQMLLLLLIGRVVGIQKMLLNMMQYVGAASFVAGISHGFLSMWWGTCILYWMSRPIDFVLGIFVGAVFIIPLVVKLRQQSQRANDAQAMSQQLAQRFGGNDGGAAGQFADMLQNMGQRGAGALEKGIGKTDMIGFVGRLTGVGLGVLNMVL